MQFKRIRLTTGILLLCIILQSFSATAGTISKSYTWAYDKKLFTIKHTFDSNAHEYYSNLRRTYSNFLTYLDESSYFPVIEKFANEFRIIAAKNNFSDWQTAELVISFIQSFEYVSDGTYEYPKFPVETLIDEGGDCEDSAILLEAILKELGFNAVLVSPVKHMGVGIGLDGEIVGTAFPHNGINYYYIETTSMGWCIGDYPDHLSENAVIYDPGQPAFAKLLSADSYSFTDTYTSSQHSGPATFVQADEPVEAEYEYIPNKNTISSSTIDVDEMVIDGQKQTIITKQVEVNGETRIIAVEE